jgi:hypothetical protein
MNLLLLFVALCTGCIEDPYEEVVSNERSIEAVTLSGDLIQVGLAVVDRAEGMVTVLVQSGTYLSKVSPQIQTSYKSRLWSTMYDDIQKGKTVSKSLLIRCADLTQRQFMC